jgi:hypothetical protein
MHEMSGPSSGILSNLNKLYHTLCMEMGSTLNSIEYCGRSEVNETLTSS